jgi:transcription factor TFB4
MGESGPTNLDDANKYRPFALIENSLLASLRNLIQTTTENDISTTSTTQMAGALTLALSYINKATVKFSDPDTSSRPAPTALENTETLPIGLQSRILVVSVSGDLAHQYIPIMNTTFAAQRLQIPIDILKLAGDTVFLQQASDATKGIYMHLRNPQGLLQYLMMAFLPDQMSRKHLVSPTQEVVDFRAACFCHRRVVDVGFVCSICLSSMLSSLSLLGQILIVGHSFLLSPGRGYMPNLLHALGARRLRRKTCYCPQEEEEKKKVKWRSGDWKRERYTSSWRIACQYIGLSAPKIIDSGRGLLSQALNLVQQVQLR